MSQPDTPLISIGIPVRNGGALLLRLLEALRAQESAHGFEVYALDSGSTDGSRAACEAHGVRVIDIPRESFDWGRLRERLFEEARGRIVVNLSQDAVPARRDWLDRLVQPLLEDEAAAVCCGHSIPDPERGFAQFAWERNGYFYFTGEMQAFMARHGRGLSFANTAVRRSVWEELRIAPQATGEDFGFQTRLTAAGKKMVFTRDAPVLHHHNYTLRGAYRRCRNEGLALREMGFAYSAARMLRDMTAPRLWMQYARELRYGRLHSAAEFLYPLLRPAAVYHGSRFARRMVWY